MNKVRLAAYAVFAGALLLGTVSACTPTPTTREDCIAAGYEWEEDSSGAECDTDDDDDDGFHVRKTSSTSKTSKTSKSSKIRSSTR